MQTRNITRGRNYKNDIAQHKFAKASSRKPGQRIPREQKLLLEAVIELGLSGNCAGQIIGLTSCARVMHMLDDNRVTDRERLARLPPVERRLAEQQNQSERKKARFEAILAVSDAFGRGLIQKSNAKRIDTLITDSVTEVLDFKSLPLKLTNGRVDQDGRELIIPPKTQISETGDLIALEEKVETSANAITIQGCLSDKERRQSLPEEVQQDEQEWLHAFLFKKPLIKPHAQRQKKLKTIDFSKF